MKSALCILKVSLPFTGERPAQRAWPWLFPAGLARRSGGTRPAPGQESSSQRPRRTWCRSRPGTRTGQRLSWLCSGAFGLKTTVPPAAGGLSKPQAPRSRGNGTERAGTAKPERQGSDKAGGFAEGLARSCKRIVAGRDGPCRQPGSDSARSSGPGAGSIVEGARGNHSPWRVGVRGQGGGRLRNGKNRTLRIGRRRRARSLPAIRKDLV